MTYPTPGTLGAELPVVKLAMSASQRQLPDEDARCIEAVVERAALHAIGSVPWGLKTAVAVDDFRPSTTLG